MTEKRFSQEEDLSMSSSYTRRDILRRTAVGLMAFGIGGILAGCGGAASNDSRHLYAHSQAEQHSEQGLLNPDIKLRAERIISSFENSTTEIQYDYAEKLGDGRGITAGRAGFTSGTHDLLLVVRRYEKKSENPDNSLLQYVQPLKSVDGTDSTAGLDGFVEAWKQTSATDPALKEAQDSVYNDLYFNPAMSWASKVGIQSALGQLIILDTIIQHGEGADQDGLPQIIEETSSVAGDINGNEVSWLNQFLDIRQFHLTHPRDPATRKEWKESVDRVLALKSILASNNYALMPPIQWVVYGDQFRLES